MKKKIVFVLILILLILTTFAGGTVYWLFLKAKSLSTSAINISGAQTTASDDNSTAVLSMPVADASGQDLANVPRYSGAVRTGYYISDDKQFTSVEYIAPVSADVLRQYYKDYLKKMNWTLNSSDQKTLNFTSVGYDLNIEIVSQNNSPVLVGYALNLTKVTQ
jgi:hypothetical protein